MNDVRSKRDNFPLHTQKNTQVKIIYYKYLKSLYIHNSVHKFLRSIKFIQNTYVSNPSKFNTSIKLN